MRNLLTIHAVQPDLSRLSRRERLDIRRYCSGKVLGDWRIWAMTAACVVPALLLPAVTGTVFRHGGIWVGMAGGAAAGLVMGAVISQVVNRICRPHLAAALLEHGRCPRCAYDLRGTPDRCPECGEVIGPRVST
jgi:hypothetical protein